MMHRELKMFVRIICVLACVVVNTGIIAKSEVEDECTLKFINTEYVFDSAMYEALEHFQEDYPNVKIEVEEASQEQLITKLLSGKGDIDVFYLNSYNLHAMVAAGAIYNLDDDDQLSEALKNWVGNSAMCIDGVRYGVPFQVKADFLVPNESLRKYAPEIDWSSADWMDVFEAALQMPVDVNGDGTQDIWFMWDAVAAPVWMNQYICSFDSPDEISFETEVFREMLDAYKKCVQNNLILDMSTNFEQQGLAVVKAGYYDSLLDCEEYYPLPLIGQERVIGATTHSLAIAKNSKNAEYALIFLQYVVDDHAQQAQEGIGYARDSEIYECYNDLTAEEKAAVENAKQYIDSAKLKWSSGDFNIFAREQMELYLMDKISIDDLVQGLQQKLQMVLWG